VVGEKWFCLSVSYSVEFSFVFNYIVSVLKSLELDVKDFARILPCTKRGICQ